MTLSYLVSTAGHSQQQNEDHPHDIGSILQLIREGAVEFGSEKVVGFACKDGQEGSAKWECHRYSYKQLLDRSTAIASALCVQGIPVMSHGPTPIVGLLCPSNIDFLAAWIALMRMGYGVLLIAPQCSALAIRSLLESTGSEILIYGHKYEGLAQEVEGILPNLLLIDLDHRPTSIDDLGPDFALLSDVKSTSDVSHIFHSSGTSGNPKPIPHTHQGSTTILPRRALPSYLSHKSPMGPLSEAAAFTTTPLFHGGISDLLRAWMARSMLYLFPTSDVPVTTSTLRAAIEACQDDSEPMDGLSLTQDHYSERRERLRVDSFLSVPYILTILGREVDGSGVDLLKGMRLVSTGGAPLEKEIGDALVASGVRLVSRLGSSECGFLLSSDRDFAMEGDWDWLRNNSACSDALVFEPVIGDRDGICELIVSPRWKSKTKTNRDDGGYATADLYRPHPVKANVWQYTGRRDDVIVMSNGEKFSPGPAEDVFRSSPLISEALVFGKDRAQVGVLLFARDQKSSSSVIEALERILVQANETQPSFALISPDMCKVISELNLIDSIPRSSKGTIQRGLAYDMFATLISSLYDPPEISVREKTKMDLLELEVYLVDTIHRTVTGSKDRTLGPTTDLFNWGVDSLMATRIRTALIKDVGLDRDQLSMNVVFENPSVASLARHVHDRQNGYCVANQVDSEINLMTSLVEKFSQNACPLQPMEKGPASQEPRTMVLTGATGSLGLELLRALGQHPSSRIGNVICLVRAANDMKATLRLQALLKDRCIELRCGIEIYSANLAQPQLGLSPVIYAHCLREADVVLHAAWPVHFASTLISFEDSIRGTRNLLDLVTLARNPDCSFFFCSSLAAVLAASGQPILETPSTDPKTASRIGYSQSKWVAENVCSRFSKTRGMEKRVNILRIGQLCGDTRYGRWNEKEGWPLMIRTAASTGSLPLLQEDIAWLPVDLAAVAILDIICGQKPRNDEAVFHVAQPAVLKWSQILDMLEQAGLPFERLPVGQWLSRVEASSDDLTANPSKKMLFLWQRTYGKGQPHPSPEVDTSRACLASETLCDLKPLDAALFSKMRDSWQNLGFM